jgi:hypothetical protein
MAKTIGNRFASMADLAAALTDYLRAPAGPTNAGQPASGAGYAATLLETEANRATESSGDAGYAATVLETEADRARGRSGKAAGPSGAGSGWESKPGFPEERPPEEMEPAVAARGRPPWAAQPRLIAAAVLGVLLLGAVV